MTDNPRSDNRKLLFRTIRSTTEHTSEPPVSRANNFKTDSMAKSASKDSPPEKLMFLHNVGSHAKK